MAAKLMPDTGGWLPAILGGCVGLSGIVAGWFQSRRKADVDQSAVVLGAWRDLVSQHQEDIKAIREEFASYKLTAQREFDQYKSTTQEEITGLRKRISLLEGDLAKEREKSAGLVRQIAQHSQSTAVLLQPNTEIEDGVAKLDRAGDNIRKGVK